MQITSKNHAQRTVATDTDEVIGWMPVPANSRVDQVWFDLNVVTASLAFSSAVMWGLGGVVVAMDDPASVDSYEDVWDIMVMKDNVYVADVLDLDTADADIVSRPQVEAGHGQVHNIFGEELLGNTQFFMQSEIASFAKSPVGFESATPDTFHPAYQRKYHLPIGVRVDRPSVALLGFSAQDLDIEDATMDETPEEAQWIILQFLEDFLQQMWIDIMGLTETGAETPYVDVTTFVAEILEGSLLEDTAGGWGNISWTVHAKTTWQMTVPGSKNITSLSSG